MSSIKARKVAWKQSMYRPANRSQNLQIQANRSMLLLLHDTVDHGTQLL